MKTGTNKILGLLSLLLIFAQCGPRDNVGERKPALEFRLALELNSETKIWEASNLFKKELEKASPADGIEAGEIKVNFYDQGMIGTERQLLEACFFGAVEVVQVNSSVVSSVQPVFSLLDLPYVFVNDDHLKEVLNGPIGQVFLDDLHTVNMQGLGFYTAGFRNIFYKSSQPCATNADQLKGLKIRVMESPVMVGAMNAIGLSATPIPFSELYQSIKTGVVDGAENSANIFVSYKYQETGCNCFTLTEHFSNQHVLIANAEWLNGLDVKYRSRILRVAKEIVPSFDIIWDKAISSAYEEIRSSHVTISKVENKKDFVNRTMPIIDQFFREHPGVHKDIYEKIRLAGAKYLEP